MKFSFFFGLKILKLGTWAGMDMKFITAMGGGVIDTCVGGGADVD